MALLTIRLDKYSFEMRHSEIYFIYIQFETSFLVGICKVVIFPGSFFCLVRELLLTPTGLLIEPTFWAEISVSFLTLKRKLQQSLLHVALLHIEELDCLVT